MCMFSSFLKEWIPFAFKNWKLHQRHQYLIENTFSENCLKYASIYREKKLAICFQITYWLGTHRHSLIVADLVLHWCTVCSGEDWINFILAVTWIGFMGCTNDDLMGWLAGSCLKFVSKFVCDLWSCWQSERFTKLFIYDQRQYLICLQFHSWQDLHEMLAIHAKFYREWCCLQKVYTTLRIIFKKMKIQCRHSCHTNLINCARVINMCEIVSETNAHTNVSCRFCDITFVCMISWFCIDGFILDFLSVLTES